MLFQSKIDRAQKWLHDRSDAGRKEAQRGSEGDLPSMEDLRAEALGEDMELEKGDFLSMLLAAMITIVPVCLLALLAMVSVLLFIIF